MTTAAPVRPIEDVIRANRARLQTTVETPLVRTIISDYQSVEVDLAARAGALATRVAADQAAGRDPFSALLEQGRLDALLNQTQAEVQRLSSSTERATASARDVAIVGSIRDVQRMAEAMDVGARLDTDAVERIVAAYSRNSPLHQSLQRLPVAARAGVRQAMVNGVAAGDNPRVVARAVRSAATVPRNQSLTLARTEVLRAYRGSNLDQYRRNTRIVSGWMWVSARDRRTCFPAGTAIAVRGETKPIEVVSVGDLVLTPSGEYRRVYEVMRRNYVGTMATIHAAGQSITATADHPFLVKRHGHLEWIEAGQLVSGDRVVTAAHGGAYVAHPRGRYVEGLATFDADALHTDFVSRVDTHIQSLTVYDINVETDHAFYANGFAVHNCAVCWAMHGSVHPLDELFGSHANCRCSNPPLPHTSSPELAPAIPTGEQRFAGLDDATQRRILGPGKWDLYRAGELKLADLVGTGTAGPWGTVRFERSLSSIRAGRAPASVLTPRAPRAPAAPAARVPAATRLGDVGAATPSGSRVISEAEVPAWFEGHGGNTLVTTHMTSKEGAAAILKNGVDVEHSQSGAYGQAFYTSKLPIRDYGDTPVKLAIRLDNPLSGTMDEVQGVIDDMLTKGELAPTGAARWSEGAAAREAFLGRGYDGIIVKHANPADGGDWVMALKNESVAVIR